MLNMHAHVDNFYNEIIPYQHLASLEKYCSVHLSLANTPS